MIYPDSVANAVFLILSSDSVLVSSGFTIQLNEEFNTDPNRAPWIGVYEGRLGGVGYRANITEPWLASYEIAVYVQAGDARSGVGIERALSAAKKAVWSAINSNRSLLGTVNLMTGFEIEPFDRQIEETYWLGTDLLTVKAEV